MTSEGDQPLLSSLWGSSRLVNQLSVPPELLTHQPGASGRACLLHHAGRAPPSPVSPGQPVVSSLGLCPETCSFVRLPSCIVLYRVPREAEFS